LERKIMSDSPAIPPITPYLTVSDARAAIDFHRRAFDANETNRMEAEDGKRLLHAALALNGAMVMLSDDFPEWNHGRSRAPGPEGGTGVTIHLAVGDVDTVMAKAEAAGATVVMPPADMFWGERFGKMRDPFGHDWPVGGPVKGA
jgi:PhnB protein